jgi:hypothetical protein
MSISSSTRWGAVATVVAAPLLVTGLASPAAAETAVDRPAQFTSAFVVNATPENVIGPDGTTPSGGTPGASGTFRFLINSELDIICYDISTTGVGADYQSAAKTATHIHETPAGSNGPPRIAFPNPGGTTDPLTSAGCFQGPFTTGLTPNGGPDTGTGFTLAQIEANPAGFSADTHTATAVPGAVRGQLVADPAALAAANAVTPPPAVTPGPTPALPQQVPTGGVRTGEGATEGSAPVGVLGAVVAAAAAGAFAVRRRQQRA